MNRITSWRNFHRTPPFEYSSKFHPDEILSRSARIENLSQVRRPVSSLNIALGYRKYTHFVSNFTLHKISPKTFSPKIKSRRDIREKLIFGLVHLFPPKGGVHVVPSWQHFSFWKTFLEDDLYEISSLDHEMPKLARKCSLITGLFWNIFQLKSAWYEFILIWWIWTVLEYDKFRVVGGTMEFLIVFISHLYKWVINEVPVMMAGGVGGRVKFLMSGA